MHNLRIRPLKYRTQSGFTLLEVLLTVVLIVVGFAFISQAIGQSLFAGSENENVLVATFLAQNKMEELRNTSYAGVANQAKVVVSGYSVFQREVVVTTPQTDLKQVSVNVYWFSKASELNISLVTYVSNI